MLTIKIEEGSEVFFTSDLHFRHGNIIKYCKRPFETVQEQTEKLIENWNKTVPDTATVFILGDFAFATKNQWRGFLNRMTGKKYLILGNHDRYEDIPTEMFEDVVDLAKVSIKIKDHEWKTFILSHMPILCWEGSNDGSIMLYGHIHTCTNSEVDETIDSELVKLMPKNSWDVGVDNNDYTPVSVHEVLEKINNKNGIK
jgi:calcineurin-like phosphoesterase family protein